MKIFSILLVLYFLNVGTALACMGPMFENFVFLKQLPQSAFNKDVIALVKVDRVNEEGSLRLVKVTVIQPVKNIKEGAQFTVEQEMHSCARPYDLKKGQTFFIAGKMLENDVFKGEWNAKEAGIW